MRQDAQRNPVGVVERLRVKAKFIGFDGIGERLDIDKLFTVVAFPTWLGSIRLSGESWQES